MTFDITSNSVQYNVHDNDDGDDNDGHDDDDDGEDDGDHDDDDGGEVVAVVINSNTVL